MPRSLHTAFIVFIGICLAFTSGGCSNAKTYTAASPELGGIVVSARASLRDGMLRVETRAGPHRVVGARLVTRSGALLGPDREEVLPDRWRSGSSMSVGIGVGTGTRGAAGTRVGVGASRPVGSGGAVEPGGFVTDFVDPPIHDQPWTLIAQIQPARRTAETDLVEAHVLLARVRSSTPVDREEGVAIERVRLPDGTLTTFRVETLSNGEQRWLPVDN